MSAKQEFRVYIRLATDNEKPISEARARRIMDALIRTNRDKDDNLVEVRVTEVIELKEKPK